MSRRDIYKVLLTAFSNPTKLSVIFLLSHNERMTVTQMSKHVRVGRPNLYHCVGQMVKDGLLSGPESLVTKNYVEKYYRLNPKAFEPVSPRESRKRILAGRPLELKNYLQSFLASLGLYFRMFAEEIARADDETLREIKRSVSEQRITLSYLILPDRAYESMLGEIRKLVEKATKENWPEENRSIRKNRVIIVGLPQFRKDTPPIKT